MMTFIEFIEEYKKNKVTSNIKLQHVLSSLGLSDVGIFLRDGPSSTRKCEFTSLKRNTLGIIHKRELF